MPSIPLRTLGTRSISTPGDFLVAVKRRAHPVEVPPHDHVFYEIAYVEAGTAEHMTAQGTRRLHTGDVIVLLPRVWHGYCHPQSFVIINCLFDGSLLRRYGAVLSLLRGFFPLFRLRMRDPSKTAPTVLHASPAQRAGLMSNFEEMMRELHERTQDWQARVIVRLLDCLVTIAHLGVGKRAEPPSVMANRASEAVVEAVEFLEARFAEAIHLDELAKRLHLSPAYLSRSFTKRMGMGLIQYQHHLRIEEACRLLRHSEEQIGRIAGRVGYDELAYFSRCFREQMGTSPRAYRDAYKGK